MPGRKRMLKRVRISLARAPRVVGTLFASGLLGACITSYDITLQPEVDDLGVGTKRQIDTALYIPDDLRTQIIEAKCPRCGSGINRIPLGQGLETASVQAFGQLFEPLTVVRSRREASQHALTIEPRIEHFEHDLIDIMDNRIRAIVVVNVTLFEGDRPVWKTSARSPESVGTEYAITISAYERSVSTAVSEALVSALKIAVAQIQGEPQLAPRFARLDRSGGKVTARQTTIGKPGLSREPLDLTFEPGPPRPDDIAVVIGNADYGRQGRDIPDVIPAYADAAAFRRYAVQALGVREGNVIDLQDATHAQMIRVFGSKDDHRGQLHDWVRAGRSNVYVYYSGHGAPGGADGNAYLVPADADAARIQLNGYALDTLYRNLGRLPAKSVTVVLEACFSGNSEAGPLVTKASPVFVRPTTPAVPANLTVVSAGAANQIASWEEDQSHGLFTKYFLRGMSGKADAAPYGNNDGKVSLSELERYLEDTVTYYARRYYGRDQKAQIATGG